jgi:AraC-like DNA-binding protein
MEKNTLYILINFAYILIFGILTGVVTLLNMPQKDGSLKSYRKSRYLLGLATGLMACYCTFRLIIPQHHGDFLDFWLLVGFTLLFSWLTYVSFLFLIESPKYRIKHFIIDGLVPIFLLLAAGITGLFFPSIQDIIMVVFGWIYGIKCAWMLYTCMKEYRKCVNEVENYYDEGPDMKWMYSTLIVSFILSISTLGVLYIPVLQRPYYFLLPVIYVYLTFKVVGFATKKIDVIRRKNLELEKEPEPAKKEKAQDLSSKLGPLVDEWVSEKKFCREGLTIKDVALEMGTNQNYLSQYLNNCLNKTFQVWLNTLRIEESKKLLTSSEKMSIEEIGKRVGIPQNYNFSRWFRVVTDMTPFQYRRSQLSGK